MNYNKNTITILSVASGALIISVGLYTGAMYLLKKERADIALFSVKVESENEKDKRVVAEKALVSETKKEREFLSNYFISNGEVVDKLQQIESLGLRTGATVKVTSVSEEAAKTEEGTSELNSYVRFSISAEGSWNEVYNFLTLLELLPMAIHVERSSIEKNVIGEGALAIQGEGSVSSGPWKGLFEVVVETTNL